MNTPIRVAMMSIGYHPLVGGAERMLATISPLLQAQNVDVHIVTRRHPGLAAFEVIDGVPVHRLSIPGPKPIPSLTYTFAALPLLRRLRPHVLHAHELFSPTTTAVLAKRLLGMPVVVTAHRSGELGDIYRLKQKMFGARRIATFRRYVDSFIAISREIDVELEQIGIPAQRRCAIANGVDTERFAPLAPAEKRALRASLGLPGGPIAIFTGRLAPEKRVNHLLAIWPAVRAAHPDAHLLVLGSGPEEARLRQAAGPGVQFAGNIHDVAPYLQVADLFVLPSIAEGLSVALLEAQASGLPAVVTAVGGAPDVIDHGANGWLIPPDDPDALRDALVVLFGDAERRASMGLRGRERIARDYALPVIAGQLRALYDRLLRDRASSINDHVPIQADHR